jgi:uncharacterized protein YprB with RNaseH-like and TPR domain
LIEMLKHTFIHIPGIGPVAERRLWSAGFGTWEDYLQRCHQCPFLVAMRNRINSYLEESVAALNRADCRYFETLLPPGKMWRLYGDLRGKTAFVDIETTGLYMGPNAITLIGLYNGRDTKVFIQGINLEEFKNEIKKYQLIVTFNGKRFDVPFIRCVLGNLPDGQAHLDLMYPLRRLGYRGGLKSVEAQMGIGREGTLKQVDGFLAVLLWREYKRGNKAALDTLVRYNLEDVVNLQFLADKVYNTSLTGLPVIADPLPDPEKYCLDDMPFDEELVDHLVRQLRERWY